MPGLGQVWEFAPPAARAIGVAIGPFQVQFSEIAKILMIVVLANYLGGRQGRLNGPLGIVGACLLVAPPTVLGSWLGARKTGKVSPQKLKAWVGGVVAFAGFVAFAFFFLTGFSGSVSSITVFFGGAGGAACAAASASSASPRRASASTSRSCR